MHCISLLIPTNLTAFHEKKERDNLEVVNNLSKMVITRRKCIIHTHLSPQYSV
jgi:hypothetical protein